MKTKLLITVLFLPFFGFTQISLLFDSNEAGGLNPAQGNPDNAIVFGSDLYFTSSDTNTSSRIYRTDGTMSGTELVRYAPSTTQNFVTLKPSWSIYTDANGDLQLAFTSHRELTVGVYQYNKLVTGLDDSNFDEVNNASSVTLGELENINDRLYFLVSQSSVSRLNLSGTVANIKSFTNSVTKLFAFNNMLYMTADDGDDAGNELYVYDPVTNATYLVADINQVLTGDFSNPNQTFGSDPDDFIEANGKLYFTADTGFGRKLCVLNGVTVSVISSTDEAEGMEILISGGITYLILSADVNGSKRLVRVNTTDDTATLLSTNLLNPKEMTGFNGFIYFSAEGNDGIELYRTAGTTGSTGIVSNINASGDSNPTGFLEYDNALYFGANNGVVGNELWSVDTSNTVALVEDFIVGPGSFSPQPFAVFNNKLYLNGMKGALERELYIYQSQTLSNINYDITNIEIFPNPVENSFFFNGIHKDELIDVSIFDINGKHLKTYQKLQEHFSIEAFPSGVYVVKIQTFNRSYSRKIIKN
ncbi:T9SS type A sorting domain-containing protein [Hyunsoonleella sp. SJ7]|uniref:T9SS type A sorting domain-containing protein n=1 Tax=Hyunsoonleella aquatilis TaxID=2762758 RepID=A0A923KJT2_9FLAO|nr:T9SS type A sorting domain-containing protein [Hyunsoonleella aquatilis]MBC3757028.1 T9SS type A sorting domain-containing protein [Hyunsoonleella aquatilis]